jgi:hypothetical protein
VYLKKWGVYFKKKGIKRFLKGNWVLKRKKRGVCIKGKGVFKKKEKGIDIFFRKKGRIKGLGE